MNDKFAYRASAELTDALRALSKRIKAFDDDVVRPWEASHHGVTSMWHRALGFEVECLGFSVKDAPVPEGLSANRERAWLIPRRGKSGDCWRDDLARLNQRPRLGPVLRHFGVEPTITVIDHSRIYTPGLVGTADVYYLTWGCEHPEPGPHLTPVRLSEYYAAVEVQL